MGVQVAACQVPDIREDVETALGWIETFALQAEADGVALVYFPECFLQGYLLEQELARTYALSLSSPLFKTILKRFASIKPALVFGMIERERNHLFNSAVVVKEGTLLGKYLRRLLAHAAMTTIFPPAYMAVPLLEGAGER